jgi:hypothetical protein
VSDDKVKACCRTSRGLVQSSRSTPLLPGRKHNSSIETTGDVVLVKLAEPAAVRKLIQLVVPPKDDDDVNITSQSQLHSFVGFHEEGCGNPAAASRTPALNDIKDGGA